MRQNVALPISLLAVVVAAIFAVIMVTADDAVAIYMRIANIAVPIAILAVAAVAMLVITTSFLDNRMDLRDFAGEKRKWGYALWVFGFVVAVLFGGAETPSWRYNLAATIIGGALLASGWLINHWPPRERAIYVRGWKRHG